MSTITLESVSGYRTKMDQRNNRHHRHRQSSSSSMNHQEDCDGILTCPSSCPSFPSSCPSFPSSCPSCPSMSRISMRIKIPQSFYLSKKSNIEMKSSYVRMKCNETKKYNQTKKSYFIPSSLFASLIISALINFVECKGGAARAGAGAGSGKFSCISLFLFLFFLSPFLFTYHYLDYHPRITSMESLPLFLSLPVLPIFCLLLQLPSLHRLWIS